MSNEIQKDEKYYWISYVVAADSEGLLQSVKNYTFNHTVTPQHPFEWAKEFFPIATAHKNKASIISWQEISREEFMAFNPK